MSPGSSTWTGWAADPNAPWAVARFRLTDDALVIVRDLPLRDVTTVVALGDVSDLSVIECAGADPILEVTTVDGSTAHLGWAPEHTPALIAALQRTVVQVGTPPVAASGGGRVPAVLAAVRDRPGLRTAAVVVAVLMVLSGALVVNVAVVYGRVDRVDMELPRAPDGVETWLLIGSDSRAAVHGMKDRDAFGDVEDVPDERADAVLLLQSGSGGRPPRLLSVPRDLLVFRKGQGVDRLALTFLDGPAATATSICRSLGVPVDHVAVIRFDGIRELVDSVGGVDVHVDAPMRDLHTGLELDAGVNILDGDAAVAWARSRHAERAAYGIWVPEPGGEETRQANQRALLERIVERMLETAKRDPVSVERLAWTLAGVVQTDRSSGPRDLVRLATTLAAAEDDGSLPHTLTPGEVPVAHLAPEAQPLLDELRHGRDAPPCPRTQLAIPPN